MSAKLSLSLLLLFSLAAQSQIGSVINHKRDAKPSENRTVSEDVINSQIIKKLTYSITKNKKTHVEKAEAIYLWITKNITYDHELRFSKKLQKEFYTSEEKIIQKVLQRNKALCGGFSFLFKKLCKQAGIESKVIHGFTKLATNYSKPNHSWNAVRLNDKWYLLDITWSLNKNKPDEPDKHWYLCNPDKFIKSHYPIDGNWALVSKLPGLPDFANYGIKNNR